MLEKIKRFDFFAFAATVALVALGTVVLYSAGHARAEAVFHGKWLDNLLTAVVGFGAYFALAFTDYRKALPLAAIPAYLGALVLLVAVLGLGSSVYGGRRWLWFFQPSEISKLCVIGLLAALFGSPRTDSADFRFGLRGLLLAGALIGVPVLLILAEPDLGTALTLLPAALVMLLVAGVWRRGLAVLVAAAALGVLALLGAVYEAEKPGVPMARREAILRFVPLREHQLRRVKVFLFPEDDVRGAGYNLRQALIAIGSGGFAGKGLGKGEASHLKYLPPSVSMNDFIFCVYAEETGFVGSLALLALYGTLLLLGCRAAFVATDGRGRLLAIGVSTLLFAHIYVNIAMSVGIVPITGLPLPFVSAGRTFLVTALCALGLVQSVCVHRGEAFAGAGVSELNA